MRTSCLLVSLAALLVSPVALAQQEPAPAGEADPLASRESGRDSTRFLVRVGATFADLRGELTFEDRPATFETDFGFAIGVGLELSVSDAVSVQPEAMIVRRFTQVAVEGGDGSESSSLSAHYLTLPVYLKWYPGGRRGSRGNLTVGAVPAILLTASREVRSEGGIGEVPIDASVADFEWGLGFGGGFEFSELFANFTVDVRYVHGLKDMNETRGTDSARWRTLEMVIGVAF